MRLNDIIFHNFWPKVISLVLAVATWFYVFDVVNTDSFSQKKGTVEDVLSRYQFTVKEVPVKPVFTGKSPSGYKVNFEKVTVEPSSIAVFGPRDVIDDVEELRTDKINIGEYTRSAKLQLGIKSDVKFLQIKDKVVDVYVPVEPMSVDGAK
jgi:YbbR domain-containing protein